MQDSLRKLPNVTEETTLAQRFGALIKYHLQNKGWSLTELALELGQNERYISHISGYISGTKGKPSRATITKFCRALDISDEEKDKLYDIEFWPKKYSAGLGADRFVVGRDDDLLKLRESILGATSVASPSYIVVKGQGGIGKTTLARAYIERYRSNYFGIWWLRAQKEQTLIDDLCDLAEVLEIVNNGSGPSARARATVVRLQSCPDPWLIIYDNANGSHQLRGWLPDSKNIHVLITSREGGWPKSYSVQEIDSITPPYATTLLMQEAERKEDIEGASRLAAALGGLPLALVNAGAWLRDTPQTSFAAYEVALAKHIHDKPETVEDYPDSVFGTVKMSIDRLSNEAALLIKIFAFLAPDDLWAGLISNLPENDRENEKYIPIPEELWILSQDPSRLDQSLAELYRRSLLSGSLTKWRIHRLTQAVQRSILGKEDFIWQDIAISVISASYPGDEQKISDRRTWPHCIRLNPHIFVLSGLPEGNRPGKAIEYIYNQASIYLAHNDQNIMATKLSIKNLKLKKIRLSKFHKDLGIAYNNLSFRLSDQGKKGCAERFSAQAVSIATENRDIPNSNRARWLSTHSLRLLEFARIKTGNERKVLLERARCRVHEALHLKRISRGSKSSMAIDFHILGLIYETRNRIGAAEIFLYMSLSLCRLSFPKGDIRIADSLLALGRVKLKKRECAAAQTLLTEALDIREEAYTNNLEHPLCVGTVRLLAAAALLCGDYEALQNRVKLYSNIVSFEQIQRRAEGIKTLWNREVRE